MNGQTDGQTHDDSIYSASIPSRGKNGLHDLDHAFFMGGLGLDILTCIGNSTTIASATQRYDWCPQNVNDLREPATSLSGMLRHRWARFCWARFCYDQLIYVTKI